MAIKADIGGIFRAMNANWTSRLFSLVVLSLFLYGWLHRNGSTVIATNLKDCVNQRQNCDNQREQLINALIEIKRSVNEMAAQSTGFNESPSSPISNAVFSMFTQDTTKRRKTVFRQPQQMQQREKLWAISRQIDSVLLMQRLDSIKAVKKVQ